MRNVYWPAAAKWTGSLPTIEAHSRGGYGTFGHYAYGIGGGARVTWSIDVVPMCTSDALKFRAFLHSLRGPAGSFLMRMPTPRLASADTLGPLGYSDDTLHSDDTPFSDDVADWAAVEQVGTANVAAAAGATSLTVIEFTAEVGAWMTVVTAAGTQLVRVVSEAGGAVGIRPALRAAVASGAAVTHGPVYAAFRLIGNAPAVPLILQRSQGFTIDCEEVY